MEATKWLKPLGTGRDVRLSGIHVWQAVFGDDGKATCGSVAIEEKSPAHGRKGPCADRTENGLAALMRLTTKSTTPATHMHRLC